MKYIIRECTPGDADGRGFVHFQSWKETYTGRLPDAFLRQITLERRIEQARQHTKNTFVAIAEGKVVGFICFLPQDPIEITGLYVLREYQRMGIGRALLSAVMTGREDKDILLFVLKGNESAISFYQRMGFVFTGRMISQDVPGGTIEELEMILKAESNR